MSEIPQTQISNENLNPQASQPVQTGMDGGGEMMGGLTPSAKKNNKLLIISGVVALMFILLGGGMWWYQNNLNKQEVVLDVEKKINESEEVVDVASDEMSDWESYKNDEFSFKYPPQLEKLLETEAVVSGPLDANAEFQVTFGNRSTVQKGTDEPFDGFSIYLQEVSQLKMKPFSFDDYLSNELKNVNQSPRGTGNAVLSTKVLEGKTFHSMNPEESIQRYFIFSPNADQIVIISRINKSKDFINTFDQILSTFEFVDDGQSQLSNTDNWKNFTSEYVDFTFKYPPTIKDIKVGDIGFDGKVSLITGSEYSDVQEANIDIAPIVIYSDDTSSPRKDAYFGGYNWSYGVHSSLEILKDGEIAKGIKENWTKKGEQTVGGYAKAINFEAMPNTEGEKYIGWVIVHRDQSFFAMYFPNRSTISEDEFNLVVSSLIF